MTILHRCAPSDCLWETEAVPATDCPECGADAIKHTYYLSPLSTVYEKEGDVHCAMCTNTWNDREQSNDSS